MAKWFVEVGFGYVGCYGRDVFEAETEEEARDYAYIMSIQNAESFGFYQDEEHFGELDSVGKDFDEDEGEYLETGSLDFHVEPYVPEKHDCKI